MSRADWQRLPWRAVRSSNVVALAWRHNGKYDEEDEPLGDFFVEYVNNAYYRYGDVPRVMAREVRAAESVGRAMHRMVKAAADFGRVEVYEEEQHE